MLSVREFHRQKSGYRAEEYEDAYSLLPEKGAFAIADGATESSFSKVWARALVKTFTDDPPSLEMNDREAMKHILDRARKEWYGSISWEGLPWFQKNKAILGSYSTFLGIQIEMEGQKRYRCITIGDSCIFHISGSKMESFPYSDYRDLNFTPRLMWSGHGYPIGLSKDVEVPGMEVKYGRLKDGDTLILATDAISKWMLQNKTEKPWLSVLENADNWDSFIGSLISSGKMRNDDVTIVFISVS